MNANIGKLALGMCRRIFLIGGMMSHGIDEVSIYIMQRRG
jgi:hypothetical protein